MVTLENQSRVKVFCTFVNQNWYTRYTHHHHYTYVANQPNPITPLIRSQKSINLEEKSVDAIYSRTFSRITSAPYSLPETHKHESVVQ